jgi:cytochrome c-type biogenesis protein CcmH
MGWLFALGFALLVYLGLALSKRCSPGALRLAAAGLLLGVAGYAWQGSPGMPGHPVSSGARP